MNAQLQTFVVKMEIVATHLVLLFATVRLGTDQVALISHAKVRLPCNNYKAIGIHLSFILHIVVL